MTQALLALPLILLCAFALGGIAYHCLRAMLSRVHLDRVAPGSSVSDQHRIYELGACRKQDRVGFHWELFNGDTEEITLPVEDAERLFALFKLELGQARKWRETRKGGGTS